jgi:hypothetical protein
LYHLGIDGILRRCVLEKKMPMILSKAHEGVVGGHYAGKGTNQNILRAGIWWPAIHKDSKCWIMLSLMPMV